MPNQLKHTAAPLSKMLQIFFWPMLRPRLGRHLMQTLISWLVCKENNHNIKLQQLSAMHASHAGFQRNTQTTQESVASSSIKGKLDRSLE